MTDRPRPPGRPLADFLAGLPAERLLALGNHLGAGVLNARNAAQCLTEAGTQRHETTLQLLAYLSEAVRELEAARAIVVGELEGRST